MINRELTILVKADLNKGKVIVITGPRQVGKTTLIQDLVQNTNAKQQWFNGDDPAVRDIFNNVSLAVLEKMIQDHKLIVIDEAQRIENIGIVLKMMVDHFKNVQVIATGSSALELADHINEPLTGRKYEHLLFPLSFSEMVAHHGLVKEKSLLEYRLIYGYYPEVVTTSESEVKRILTSIADSYLYKDLLVYEKVKKPGLLQTLLKALALQLGSEVSYQEVGRTIGADKQTVERYIDLLEKTFVVFRLNAFSRNVRNELKKSRKIYFYDNGIRNAILGNYTPLDSRNDKGALWENFLISERFKKLSYSQFYGFRYFWRTTQQQEVDYIEEVDGNLLACEFKWNEKDNVRIPKTFISAYPEAKTLIINNQNFIDFVL